MLHTWRSNIKAEIRGMNTGKLFPAILQSYFSYLFLHFFLFISWGFPVGRICSAPTAKNLRKTKLQKTKGECYHCWYILPITTYCIGRQLQNPKFANSTTLTRAISSKNSNPAKTQLILLRTKSKPLPEKTDVGTVKMVEDNCEAIVS